MGRSPYQSEKRRKEIARLQKQEEKRQKRFAKRHSTGEPPVEGVDGAVGQPADAPGTGDGAAPGTGTPPDVQPGGSPGEGTPAT